MSAWKFESVGDIKKDSDMSHKLNKFSFSSEINGSISAIKVKCPSDTEEALMMQ